MLDRSEPDLEFVERLESLWRQEFVIATKGFPELQELRAEFGEYRVVGGHRCLLHRLLRLAVHLEADTLNRMIAAAQSATRQCTVVCFCEEEVLDRAPPSCRTSAGCSRECRTGADILRGLGALRHEIRSNVQIPRSLSIARVWRWNWVAVGAQL